MTLNEILNSTVALGAGLLLGILFFGGLWWTIQKAACSRRPVTWFFGSLLVRTGLALAGFYFVAYDHWGRLLLCLLGFVLGRLLVTWRVRVLEKNQSVLNVEASHAP